MQTGCMWVSVHWLGWGGEVHQKKYVLDIYIYIETMHAKYVKLLMTTNQ